MIIFSTLSIELTRMCNMSPQCRHCMRGTQQNVTISDSDLDDLFRQTEMIQALFFTGGEPLIALDRMRSVLRMLKDNKIPVYCLAFTTNGLSVTEEAIDVIKSYSTYIDDCRSKISGFNTMGFNKSVIVQVSFDKYHFADSNIKSTIENNTLYLRQQLQGYADVTMNEAGNTPVARGLAKKLPIWNTHASNIVPLNLHRIEVCSKDHKPVCCPENPNIHNLVADNQRIVLCDVCVTAKGNVVGGLVGDTEYSIEDQPDNIICRCTDDIWSSIFAYNDGKLTCTQYDQLVKDAMRNDPKVTLHNNLYAMVNADRLAAYEAITGQKLQLII